MSPAILGACHITNLFTFSYNDVSVKEISPSVAWEAAGELSMSLHRFVTLDLGPYFVVIFPFIIHYAKANSGNKHIMLASEPR